VSRWLRGAAVGLGLMLVVGNACARPLRVAYTHWFACVPLGIAEDRKFWRDAGLQVELRDYQTNQEVVAALKDGEVDIGYAMIADWVDVALGGAPVTIIGETDWSDGGDKLLLRKGATLAGLKGSPIAVAVRGSAVMLFLRESLRRENLSVSDFPIVEVPDAENGLKLFTEEKLQAVVSNEPWASRIEKAGAAIVATTADFPGVAPEGFAARRGQVDDATLKSFFSVWFRAVAFLRDPANQRAVAEIASVYAFAGAEAITPADVAGYARTTPVHDAATALRHNDLANGNARQLIQRFTVLMRLQGGRPLGEADLAKFFQLEPLREVAAQAAGGATPAMASAK